MDGISIDILARFVEHMPHAADIGMTMDGLAPSGKLRLRIAAQPMLAADTGEHFFFPGILFSLADTACGMATGLHIKLTEAMSTLDLRIDHFAPASLKHDLVAEAECYCVTRSVVFARCELYSGPHRRLVASATGAFMRAAGKPPKLPVIALTSGAAQA